MDAQIVFKKRRVDSPHYIIVKNLVSIVDSFGRETTDFSKFEFRPNINYTFVGDEVQLVNSSEVLHIQIS